MPRGSEQQQEPNWPVWEKRGPEHYDESAKRGDCDCQWVEPVLEDLALYGLPSRVLCVCVGCGRVWSRGA